MRFNTQAEIDEYCDRQYAEIDRERETVEAIMFPLIAILVGIFLGSILFLAVTS